MAMILGCSKPHISNDRSFPDSTRLSIQKNMEAFIYVLSNPSMPGLVKVGVTEKMPALRATEMSAHEGLPTPMVLEYYALLEGQIYDHERRAHRQLTPHHFSKEWFRCTPEVAIAADTTLRSTSCSTRSMLAPTAIRPSALNKINLRRDWHKKRYALRRKRVAIKLCRN